MVGAPVNVQMNISMSDLDYVGDVTGTAVQSYVIGIPYGGKSKYYQANLYGGVNPPVAIPFVGGDRGLNAAMSDAMNQHPDADFLIPFNIETVTNQEFLGSKRTYTVHAKAFKIKSK